MINECGKRTERIREILFRGKRWNNGEWVEGFYYQAKLSRSDKELCHYITIPHPESDGQPSDHIMVYPETVGQFTGLTDKNGKKIFEGDIILFEDESPSNYEYHDSTEMRCGEIKFDDGQFYITNRIAVEMEDLIYYGTIEGEVMGNIHDNPELLEVLVYDS